LFITFSLLLQATKLGRSRKLNNSTQRQRVGCKITQTKHSPFLIFNFTYELEQAAVLPSMMADSNEITILHQQLEEVILLLEQSPDDPDLISLFTSLSDAIEHSSLEIESKHQHIDTIEPAATVTYMRIWRAFAFDTNLAMLRDPVMMYLWPV
jgi:hypothetical protein